MGYRILVVEDNPHVADIFRLAFKRVVGEHTGRDVEVEQVADGREAIEAVEAAEGAGDPFRLVVLDLMLPVMDGFEVLARLRSRPATERLPVLVVTAADPETAERAVAAGATAAARKPLPFAEIRRLVAQVL